MNNPPGALTPPETGAPAWQFISRRELRLLSLGGAVLIIALFVFYAFTLKPPLSPAALLAFALLSLALAVGYFLLVSRSSDLVALTGKASFWRVVLPISLAAAGWPFVFTLLLHGRAELYFYVVAFDGYSALILMHGRRWALFWVAGLIALAGVGYLLLWGWAAAGAALLGDLPWFGFLVGVSELFARQWEQRERTEALAAQQAQAYQQLQTYTAQAEALAVSQERNRLAHEIHDTVGHTLAALGVQMELLARLPADQNPARANAAGQARALLQAGQHEVWRAVQALRPATLDVLSLPESMRQLADDFARMTGIEVAWQLQGETHPLPSRYVLPLYRAVQEALTNVQRHAPTTEQINVLLRYAPDSVALTVENSAPSRPASLPPAGGEDERGGHGLRGLRERAETLGGRFRAGPTPTGGFRLHISIPVADETFS